MMMTTSNLDRSSACMLRWVLANGPAAIACEIDANVDRSFDLRVVPLSMPTGGFIEHFQTATSAMERHAQIARQLREQGWHRRTV